MKKQKPVDVCIIGAGAAGGILAQELSEAGMSVVVIEAGLRFDDPFSDYANDPIIMRKFRFPEASLEGEALGHLPFAHNASGLGGGTLHWMGAAFRLHESDFRVATHHGGKGADWPITLKDLVPYYAKAEAEWGISGPPDNPWEGDRGPYPNPPHKLSCMSEMVMSGANKVGMRFMPGPTAALSRPYRGRAECNHCGFCMQGCMQKAMASTARIQFPRAERTGRCKVLTSCMATRVESKNGKATGVIYFDSKRRENFQAARVVIVSAHVSESPRLLLNSATNEFPNGLANSSGVVGKHYMTHPSRPIAGIFENRVDGYRGYMLNNIYSQEFYETSSKNKFIRGYTLEAASSGAPLQWINQFNPTDWGVSLKDKARSSYAHIAELMVVGEQLGNPANAVTLSAEKDSFGMPKARITHGFDDNDQALVADGIKKCTDILMAAGATKVVPGAKVYGPHNMGTVRMGNDPQKSVVNSYCQTHDIKNLFVCDASVFPSSGGCNPTMTIAAIAYRSAEYLIGAAKRHDI